ncbi:hypothetical protein Hanom_Chr07g00616341 [Helianthus anomalus]
MFLKTLAHLIYLYMKYSKAGKSGCILHCSNGFPYAICPKRNLTYVYKTILVGSQNTKNHRNEVIFTYLNLNTHPSIW